MPLNKTILAWYLLVFIVTAPEISKATSCDKYTDVHQDIEEFYSAADVVFMVDDVPEVLKIPKEMEYEWPPVNEGWLLEYKVLKVWKGEVGPKVFVSGNIIERGMENLVFGLRGDGSGPVTPIGHFICLYETWDEVLNIMDNLYGPGYAPSKTITESVYTNNQKMALLAAIGIGLVGLGSLFWFVPYFMNGQKRSGSHINSH